MFDRLRKSGARGDIMRTCMKRFLTSLIVILDELMKAAEQMRALCVNLSPPITMGSPYCVKCARVPNLTGITS
jgi:hypothetical protein